MGCDIHMVAEVRDGGEFPLGGMPRWLHHCNPGQFIQFGELVRSEMIGMP